MVRRVSIVQSRLSEGNKTRHGNTVPGRNTILAFDLAHITGTSAARDWLSRPGFAMCRDGQRSTLQRRSQWLQQQKEPYRCTPPKAYVSSTAGEGLHATSPRSYLLVLRLPYRCLCRLQTACEAQRVGRKPRVEKVKYDVPTRQVSTSACGERRRWFLSLAGAMCAPLRPLTRTRIGERVRERLRRGGEW